MIVAGDICYNGLHRWLVEAKTAEKRQAWVAALQQIAALRPATVIAINKRLGAADGFNNVYSTVKYIETFGDLKSESGGAKELYQKTTNIYTDRVNPVIL